MGNSEHTNRFCGRQRVTLAMMAFLGLAVSFTTRSCLSIAVTEMVSPMNVTQEFNELNTSGKRFNWTQEQQSWILSSYFVGYVISHIPGGILAQQFGGKWTLSLGILISTICTAVIPEATKYGGYVALIILRMVMGLAGGTTFPALSVLISAWIPLKERGRLGTLVLGGGTFGAVLSLYVSGLILSFVTWPFVYYFWSAISIVWVILFILICYNDPSSHPFISMEEKIYLKTELGQLNRQSELPPTPWKDILISGPVLALLICQVGSDWTFHILASDLPKYMKEVLNFSVYDIGLYTSLPRFLTWVSSLLVGTLSDYLITKNYITIVHARKLFTALSAFGPASFIVAASYAGHNIMLVVTFLMLSETFTGFYHSGMRINSLDLSPNYAGSLMALTNGVGAITGVIAPNFVGIMAPDSSLEQWRLVFWVTFGITVVRTTIYLIWASADIQPWNNPKETKSLECEKLSA